jgi:isopentenyl phosphate kinase
LTELVFVKLGGSLITHKSVASAARPRIIRRMAREIRSAMDESPGLKLVLGHGSGSFGHVVAHRYGVQSGCKDWQGYALTSAAAARLNRIVVDEFLAEGVPVVAMQPSASARCQEGRLADLAWQPVAELLEREVVPLVYGDVALDEVQGSTIVSTESIFAYLAHRLKPARILLVGEVRGIYTSDPHLNPRARLIRHISAEQQVPESAHITGSNAVDVTGGMHSKVAGMAALVRELPGLRVLFLSGSCPGVLRRSLLDIRLNPGTALDGGQ